MGTTRYSKLVRDKIPEFLSEKGKTCRTRILSQEAYLQKLDEKLQEELSEFLESHAIEELADLCEVIRAVMAARGWDPEALERARSKKAAERGAFARRILLESVTEPENGHDKV